MQEEADMVRMHVSFYTPNSWTAATWLCTTVAKTMSIKHDLLGMQREQSVNKRGGGWLQFDMGIGNIYMIWT